MKKIYYKRKISNRFIYSGVLFIFSSLATYILREGNYFTPLAFSMAGILFLLLGMFFRYVPYIVASDSYIYVRETLISVKSFKLINLKFNYNLLQLNIMGENTRSVKVFSSLLDQSDYDLVCKCLKKQAVEI